MRSNTSAKPTVLLVEDEPILLLDYAAKIKFAGYRVLSASSAELGIYMAQYRHIDVILTDNVLPGMAGLRSIGEYAKYSRAPVLVMTSDYSAEIENDALLLGATCCLRKPLDFSTLLPALARFTTY